MHSRGKVRNEHPVLTLAAYLATDLESEALALWMLRMSSSSYSLFLVSDRGGVSKPTLLSHSP